MRKADEPRAVLAPFTPSGSLFRKVPWEGQGSCQMRGQKPFEETLRFLRFVHARSTYYGALGAEDGREFPVSLCDLEHVLRHPDYQGGQIRATWKIVRRGGQYGLMISSSHDR